MMYGKEREVANMAKKKLYKNFNGKRHTRGTTYDNKASAQSVASRYRKAGFNARVHPESGKGFAWTKKAKVYTVFIRKRGKR
jgi:hypothetical protein